MKRTFDEVDQSQNDSSSKIPALTPQGVSSSASPSSTTAPKVIKPVRPNYKTNPSCPICGTPEHVIEDLRNGCVVCTNCGGQIGGQIISEGAEWRTFADDGSKNNADPSRVGGLDDSIRGLGTTMAGGGALGHRHNQASLSSEQQIMERVLRLCKTYQRRLSLENQIYVEAERICKQVIEAKVELRGKSLKQDTLAAVCIYLACRNKSQDRRKADVVAVADVNEKAFNKQFQRVTNIFHDLSKNSSTDSEAPRIVPRFDASNFVQRYGSTLGLPRQIINVAECVVVSARDLDIMGSAQPANLAIAALYFVYLIDGETDPLMQKKMQNVATINIDTLIKLAKLFHDKRMSLVPIDYRPNEIIERMPRPEKHR